MATEKRLVYASEVEEIFNYEVHTGATDLLDAFDSAIQNATTVDAVEVVHGRWVEKPNPWGQDGSHSYDCSICGERTCVVGHKLRYCPNCGAKMDGDGNV